MTRPDRSQFFFDADGYQTAVVDKNGNDLRFTYERVKVGNRNTGVLKYITDATGRRTLTFEYYAQRRRLPRSSPAAATSSSTGRTWPTPRSSTSCGRSPTSPGGGSTSPTTTRACCGRCSTAQGTPDEKPFGFYYDDAGGQNNPKLVRGRRPARQRHEDRLLPRSRQEAARARPACTDRNDKDTTFTYRDPDGSTGVVHRERRDRRQRPRHQVPARRLRPAHELLTNAKNQKTEPDLGRRQQRPAPRRRTTARSPPGRTTRRPACRWRSRIRRRTRTTGPAQKLEYRFGLKGHTAELTAKTSPGGPQAHLHLRRSRAT